MTTDLRAAAAAYAIEQIYVLADRIREAWTWLADLAEPGPTTTAGPAPAETDDRAEHLEAAAHEARAYRIHNLRHGMSALPPSPAPVRLAIVDAQIHIHQIIATAVLTLAQTGGPLTQARADTATATGVPGMLDWLVGAGVGLGVTGRDGVWLRQGAIDRVRDPQLAADVERLLTRADRTARAAAGDVDDPGEQLVDPDTNRPARCPACRRRSLQRQSTGLIRCVSQSCLCTGDAEPDRPECGCRRTEKRPDLGHVWTRGSEHELWDAIDTARPVHGVGRGATGHGGWQSRDMAGRQ